MLANKRSPIRQAVGYFFKFFFHLLYHDFAWTYDWVAAIVSLGRWKTWTLCVLPYLENSITLELGSGPGHLQVALAKKGISAYALDSSPQMTRLASKRLSKNIYPVNISLGRAQDLPYPDGKFDKIVTTFPSEYISDPLTLNQARRVLNDQGELIILPVAWITGKKWWDKLAADLFRITGQAPDINPESNDYRDLVPVDFLENAGFQVCSEIIHLQSSKVLLIRAVKTFARHDQAELG
jgi:ubiquinone/menaquinone biosynthesis C-methylase UbiE